MRLGLSGYDHCRGLTFVAVSRSDRSPVVNHQASVFSLANRLDEMRHDRILRFGAEFSISVLDIIRKRSLAF